ncbi:MAG: TIR domain-containing protein [Promethearchaeota archaeon]
MEKKEIIVFFLTLLSLVLLLSLLKFFPLNNINQEKSNKAIEDPQSSFTEADITTIFLNSQNETQTKYIEIDYNEILNITIIYSEILTGNFISGATVGLTGETINDLLTEGLNSYYVLINTASLNLGINNLNISAQKTNYTSILVIITVNVLDIFPNIIIQLPLASTYWDEPPLIKVIVFDENLDKIWYNVSGALSFKEFLQNDTAEYLDYVIWESIPLGMFKINFYANDTDGNMSWKELQIVKQFTAQPNDWQIVVTAIIIGVVVLTIIAAISLAIRKKVKQRGIRVFISHAITDYDEYQISNLAKYLQKQKGIYKVDYCEEGMVGNIDDWMETRVPRSQLLIIFFTENSAYSKDCINELKLAFRHNINIMPILGANMNWEQLKEKARELEINISREFGMEFPFRNSEIWSSEDLKKFNKNVYDYVMRVKKSLEEEIQRKKGKGKKGQELK